MGCVEKVKHLVFVIPWIVGNKTGDEYDYTHLCIHIYHFLEVIYLICWLSLHAEYVPSCCLAFSQYNVTDYHPDNGNYMESIQTIVYNSDSNLPWFLS